MLDEGGGGTVSTEFKQSCSPTSYYGMPREPDPPIPWIAWKPQGAPFTVHPHHSIEELRCLGVTWIERGYHGTDYPLHRVTPDVQNEFNAHTVEQLDNIPFLVLWPQ